MNTSSIQTWKKLEVELDERVPEERFYGHRTLKYLKYLLQTKGKKTQQIQIIISFRGFEFNVEVCEQIVSEPRNVEKAMLGIIRVQLKTFLGDLQ